MIKNQSQLIRSIEMLTQVNKEINELRNQKNRLLDNSFYLIPLLSQKNELEEQIIEYQNLLSSNLETSVTTILDRPVLLDNIGELLSKLRIAAKISQTEMAKKLGWEQSNLSRFENENYSSQTISKVVEYASALGIWLHIRPSLSEEINFSRSINYLTSLENNDEDINTSSCIEMKEKSTSDFICDEFQNYAEINT